MIISIYTGWKWEGKLGGKFGDSQFIPLLPLQMLQVLRPQPRLVRPLLCSPHSRRLPRQWPRQRLPLPQQRRSHPQQQPHPQRRLRWPRPRWQQRMSPQPPGLWSSQRPRRPPQPEKIEVKKLLHQFILCVCAILKTRVFEFQYYF